MTVRVVLVFLTCLVADLAAAAPLGGTFHQSRYLPEHDVTLETTGSFALLPGEGLIWATRTPFATTLIVARDGLYQLNPAGDFSGLDEGRGALELTILDRMLSGDPQALVKTGIFTLSGETQMPDGDTQIRGVMKTPSGKSEPVTLRVSGGADPVLREIVFWAKDAQGRTYEASAVRLDMDSSDRAELLPLWQQFQGAH
ncbi:LolA family protein [Ruegeria sp. MALMAid1280]|uniref:LolA family protein n=1 Tax=Ruegeria sp. MALMAid1280 TaxID=3411634 RepID=UPI003BA11D6E